jgi:hypothetical protein
MMDAHRSFEHLIGLRLSEARRLLEEDDSCASWPLEIIATAPPQAPQHPARVTPRKVKHPARDRVAQPEKWFGEWRVLRCLLRERSARQEAAHHSPGLQLFVAREELKPLAVENSLRQSAPAVEKAAPESSLSHY